MPLKDRKPFKRLKPPKDLKPDEELFYVKATHEVFRNYDDFFERVIMCNSLVWSCALTGKSNLTFQEAATSEEAARHSLKTFPFALRKPILYLASLTHRKRLNELCDDVFNYVKDRFFVGEEVEVVINGVRKSSEVTQVILPERAAKSPTKVENSKPKKPKDIPPSKIKYEVVNYSTGRTTVVKPDCMSRPKGTYTKPRNKLFLKHHTHPKDGEWKVKDQVLEKEQLDEFQFSEVFCGPLPSYTATQEKKKTNVSDKVEKTHSAKKSINETPGSGKKTVQGKLNFKKETAEDKKKSIDKQAVSEKQRIAAEKERLKKELLKKQKIEEEKERQKQEKLNERLKKKEQKKIMTEYMNSWKKPRDDLECDDLKDLPPPVPVDCNIPQNCFGDAIMILEFLNTFEKQVQVKDIFPQNVSFEQIEKALTETDIQAKSIIAKRVKLHDLDGLNIDTAMDLAAVVSKWSQTYQGTILRNIPLDSFSISEILRLHILSSGHKRRVNWQGVVTASEDPGLYFKLEEPELIKKLSKTSVFELNAEERCKILTLLIHQLLSCDVLRYAVDENADKTRPLRNQLKQLRWAHSRMEKDTNNKKKVLPKEDKPEGEEQMQTEEAVTLDEEEKENTDNLSPEEKAELEEKKTKEAAKQKAEFLRKEREIEAQIRKLQSSFNVAPLGKDRAFRRYWVFQTVAGVFVEDDDPFRGNCLLKATTQNPSPHTAHVRCETAAVNIKKYLQNIDAKSGSSDKENEILRDIAIVQSDLPFPLKNRKLSDLNPRVDSKKGILDNNLPENEICLLCKNKKSDKQDFLLYCPHSKNNLPMDQCSANIDTCPVHNMNAPRTKWSFYYNEDDVENLISGLNSRGFRERALKEALINEKERIREMMTKVPYCSFNKTLPLPPQPEVRKSQRHQNSQSSSYAGMSPRQAQEITLRDMILEFEHRVFHGGLGSLKVPDREKWRSTIEQGAFVDVKEEADKEDSIKEESSEKICPAPVEEMVKELANAMLQLSQCIESKYLNPPLGESDESKKAKQKALEDPESQQKKKSSPSNKSSVSPLEKWQESLMQCTSTSQLFVHLGTLERSVAWSRSVLKAHCRICRRRGDAENMLLCDGCNRGHHLYCLKPPLSSIPEGDWFCLSCKPIEKPVSPQKKPRKAESDSEEGESDEDSDQSVSEEEEDEEDGESVDEDSVVQESCEVCNDVGTLLCCDKCPLMYHPECVGLKRVPRGEWMCPQCTKKEEAIKKAQKHPSGSYGTRSSTLVSDSKKKPNPLRNKLPSRGVKRKYEDSFEEEFEPSRKSSRGGERKSYTTDSEKEDNPFKKVYRDSAINSARRRSKTGIRNGSDMLDYKACIDLLVELMRHPSSWPFLVPVSKKDAPDYHQIIKRPMDFGTIRSKLNYMNYKNNEDFIRDIFLVLQNCEWFNPKSSPEYKAAQVINKEVKRLIQEYQICNPQTLNSLIPNVNES
ncbi:bromodomain adjacent to zinc finger domain protein 1A [Trichonephila inaurata madagascariensis]|uniref:Bromodomain adjacent to zinc finger domain protein 1A n=1 Tax=Trichonephila inaurata madagascariensis TaxID=2747483 RepID=A0A8X6XPT8_9ARAC|nr:bromodomain adjacent to zinc finger domain protein 1A [Trichonephila inaurata madagascariensis]